MKRYIVLMTGLLCCDGVAKESTSETSSDTVTEGGPNDDFGIGASSFTVTVNGVDVPVSRVHRFDSPVNFVRFDHVPGATISVTSENPYETYTLSPSARGIAATRVDNTISFAVPEPEYLIFQPDSLERLLILIDPPDPAVPVLGSPGVINIMDYGVDNSGGTLTTAAFQAAIDALEGSGNILFVPPGTYLVGELWMKSGMTLYLSEGSWLKGSDNLSDIVTANSAGSTVEQCLHALVRMYNVTNSHIRGRGIIDGNGGSLRDEDIPETKYNLLKIEDSSNCSVDGIIAMDSSFWSTIVYRSDAVAITNYKVINRWEAVGWNETDGVDFDNASNSILSNAMLYVGDDCMATKSDDIPDDYVLPGGVSDYPADPTVGPYVTVNNVIHENVVCFTNQAAAKVGTKTMGAEMSDIVFRNIDVIKCGRGMVIDNMDTAAVHDIVFDNITFEYITPFDAANFIIRNGTDWRYSEGVGTIENVSASNIILKDFPLRPLFRIEGRNADDTDPPTVYPVSGINFTNVLLNGELLTDANIDDKIRLVTHEADEISFQ